jgi:hypothetical protein
VYNTHGMDWSLGLISKVVGLESKLTLRLSSSTGEDTYRPLIEVLTWLVLGHQLEHGDDQIT